jgi:glycosyltransferase involved in cell wall biosynthesis
MSYDGMTDPLGQSQVIPYIQGLSKAGYEFTLISFEKPERYEKNKERIGKILAESNIDWVPLSYTKQPPVLSTLYDVWRLKKKAYELHEQKNFSIVHCRSYITSLVGLQMKQELGVKFIFDMRGFYADERVDGGLWRLNNPVYKRVYHYFKKKEKEFLTYANHTISLTEAGKREIQSWKELPNQPVPIQVIPCCADLDKFSPDNIDQSILKELRAKFSLQENDFVLSYLGSIGTWYLMDEMLEFFKQVLKEKPQARFLFITNEPASMILDKAKTMHIPAERFIITPSPHHLVPTHLALSTVSIFFIKPVFSKKASSPTKQGEIMGMGIPYICNGNVGDVDEIVADTHSGYVVKDFAPGTYREVIDSFLRHEKLNSQEIRRGAFKYYSLEEGVRRYKHVYETILA